MLPLTIKLASTTIKASFNNNYNPQNTDYLNNEKYSNMLIAAIRPGTFHVTNTDVHIYLIYLDASSLLPYALLVPDCIAERGCKPREGGACVSPAHLLSSRPRNEL